MVWIIVLNWNGWRDTIACLASLRPAVRGAASPSAQASQDTHVVVVDNGSTDESLLRLEEFRRHPLAPMFEIIETGKNLGFAGGNNVGIRHALRRGATWVLLLNNDTTVTPDFLERLLEASDRDARIGMANPKILLADKPNHFWFIGGKLNWMRARGSHIAYGTEDRGQYDGGIRDTEYATGCCLLVRRELIEDIGLLPEAYFLYYEDAEWSIRARRRKWRCVVVPAARIFHKGAAVSKEDSPVYIRYHVRNGLLLARRVGNPIQIAAAYSVSLLRAARQLPKFFGTRRQRRFATATLLGIRDAWLGRTGPIREN